MKVFCTGWQRTGTTSLAKALKFLGLETLDWPKELFRDIDDDVIRRYDAFTDNPIPLLYKELDRRHPGSRFIHTVRDDEAWLKSAEWLFTLGMVKFNWRDGKDGPILAEMHRELYGTTVFDAELFLERYCRHNREVAEYFADRPDDLLVVDITRGEGFERLCPFLGLPLPAEPFPHWNRREPNWKVRLRSLARRFRPQAT